MPACQPSGHSWQPKGICALLRALPSRSVAHFAATIALVGLMGVVTTVSDARIDVSGEQLQRLESRYGSHVRRRVEDWLALIMSEKSAASDMDKLRAANNFFNRLDFIEDIDHWGEEDYWATPIEFMATSAGDCEDFSIAKYFTLLEMGVDAERLRITYVKAIELDQAHMVLAYYKTPNADPLILDNLEFTIEKGSRRRDLKPVYSFNGEGLWMAVARGQGKRVGTSGQIKLWQSLITRMEHERTQ